LYGVLETLEILDGSWWSRLGNLRSRLEGENTRGFFNGVYYFASKRFIKEFISFQECSEWN